VADTITSTGKLNVLTAEDGDLTFEWTHGNTAEENIARKAFADAKDKGYFAYAVKTVDGEPSNEAIKEFDASLEKIVMSPQLVGG
jgi:hypothetical protein